MSARALATDGAGVGNGGNRLPGKVRETCGADLGQTTGGKRQKPFNFLDFYAILLIGGGEITVCSLNQLERINQQMVACYKDAFGGDLQHVILFGSYARGDYDQESDIDYTAIVNGERRNLQQKMNQVWDSSAELGMENDVVISPTVIPSDEYEKYRTILPYYRNIDREGILVG